MQQFSPPGYQSLPPVVKNIIIINVIMFLATIALGMQGIDLCNILGLHSWQDVDANGNHNFKLYQLITHAFLHGGNLMGPAADYEGGVLHLFMNMFGLWMFGTTLERLWGAKRFINFYLLCAVGAAIAQMAYQYYQFNQENIVSVGVSVGASGAIFGILAAFAYLFPNSTLYLYFFIPIKTYIAIILYGIYEFIQGIQNSAGDNIAHFAHLGGMITGFLIVFVWNKINKKKFY
jgi:membrane associated rhomboid family serine protease